MIGSGEHSIFVKVNKGEKVMINDGTIITVGEDSLVKKLRSKSTK